MVDGNSDDIRRTDQVAPDNAEVWPWQGRPDWVTYLEKSQLKPKRRTLRERLKLHKRRAAGS